MNPSDTLAQRTAPKWLLALAVVGLLSGLAVSLRFYVLRDGFSEDEFFQLAFVNEPWPSFLVLFVRLDQHPFFHFLQLKIWALVSQSDSWMLLNSLAWHVASCVIIFLVGRAWRGLAVGLVAAAMYCLLPQVVNASITLRFYAMIPGLAVLSWWLNLVLLSGKERRAWVWVALALVQVALGYSHAIAFFFCGFIAIAAAVQVAAERPPERAWKRWLWVQGGVALLLLPLVVLAFARITMAPQGEPGGNSDPGTLIDHFGGMVSGWGMKWAWGRELGAAFFALAVAAGLWFRPTRWVSAVMLLGPYTTALLVGLVLAPMFKTPVYSAMLVPFACLALAAAVVAMAPLVAVPLLAALMMFSGPASAHLNDAVSPYRPVAEELQRRVQPGDVVVVPKPYMYWAVMRYTIGPDWGSPLAVLPKPPAGWQRIIDRLGPDAAQALRLVPRTNVLEHRGVRYVIGEDAVDASRGAARAWVVVRPRYPAEVRLDAGLSSRGMVFEIGRPETTRIELYQRALALSSP